MLINPGVNGPVAESLVFVCMCCSRGPLYCCWFLFLDSLCKEVANSFDCVGRRAEIVPLYIPKFVTLLLRRSHKTSPLVEEPCPPPHLIAVIYKEHPIFIAVKRYGHEMNLAKKGNSKEILTLSTLLLS
jgi:hypothetical protein